MILLLQKGGGNGVQTVCGSWERAAAGEGHLRDGMGKFCGSWKQTATGERKLSGYWEMGPEGSVAVERGLEDSVAVGSGQQGRGSWEMGWEGSAAVGSRQHQAKRSWETGPEGSVPVGSGQQ